MSLVLIYIFLLMVALCRIQGRDTLRIGHRVGFLFELVSLKIPSNLLLPCAAATSLAMWHYRLGHVLSSKLRPLISRGVLGSVSNEQFDCVSCQLGKHHTLPFNNSDCTSSAPFDLIHSNIWGPHLHQLWGDPNIL